MASASIVARTDESKPILSLERLEVHRAGIDFLALVEDMIAGSPRGQGVLSDELRRAATPIVLNTAGSSKYNPKEKARFYRTARRSAGECVFALDVAHRQRRITSERRAEQGRSVGASRP